MLPSLFLTPDYVSLGTISDNDPTKFSAAVASKIFDDAAPVLDGTPAAFIDVETLPLSKEELAEVNGLSGIRVNVTIKPEMPLGDFSEKIWFSTPKVPGYRMSLEISGRRQGPFLFVGEDWHDKSSTIRLGDFPAKKGKKVRISIFSAEKDGPLTLEVAEQDPAEMIVKIHQREGDVNDGQVQHYVDVEIPAGLPPARRVYEKGGYIVIKTSHPQVPTMKLRVSYISGT
ncbi:MAG: hypothetical protein R3C01_14410 [Planctomycetaceae bacterium]